MRQFLIWMRSCSRASTMAVCTLSLLSTSGICLIWIPIIRTARVDATFRPMFTLPLVGVVLVSCLLPSAFLSCAHICFGPRRLGLLLLIISIFPYLLFRAVTWLYIDQRGIPWG